MSKDAEEKDKQLVVMEDLADALSLLRPCITYGLQHLQSKIDEIVEEMRQEQDFEDEEM